jgi:hypothetical protein
MLAVLLMSMLAKARPQIKEPAPGKVLKTLPMGFLPRFQLQRLSLFALLTGIALGVTTGWLSTTIAIMIGLFALIPLLVPMKYTFTTKGVSVGDGVFYPWSEFSGFTAKDSAIKLDRSSIFGNLTLFVKPVEMSNVLVYVEKYIKG